MHLRPLIRFFIYKLNEGKKKQKKIAKIQGEDTREVGNQLRKRGANASCM